MTYQVFLTHTATRRYEVDAEDGGQAEQMARNAFLGGDDGDEVVDDNIENIRVEGEKGENANAR
jgi:hypothetical protein